MAEALEGLDSVRAVTVDLDDDRFDIRFVRSDVEADDLADVITELGYHPEIVASPRRAPSVATTDPNHDGFHPTDAALQGWMKRAEAEHKPLLLSVYTPG